jgi:hypothetical protein
MNVKQEIFNVVYSGMKAQDFARSYSNGECMYRGRNGMKCGVGHCIPDEHYSTGMEFEDASHPLIVEAVCARFGLQEDEYPFSLLSDIQTVHDDEDFDTMQERLENLARDYGLTIPSED